MKKLLIATQNKGKIREYQQMLAELRFDVIGLADVGLGDMEVEETGTSFEENAEIKARAYAQASGLLALSDDSGLEVDALGSRPGVYSARYGGEGLSYPERRAKLLGELEDTPDIERGAQFVCVIALTEPDREEMLMVRGVCRGWITRREFDEGYGFGYDPVFVPDGYDRTFAQMSPEKKDSLSHRGIAVQNLIAELKRVSF